MASPALDHARDLAADPALLAITHRHAAALGKPHWIDYHEGLERNYHYLFQQAPHLLRAGLRVLDIGPGPGHVMLLLRCHGADVWGEDAAIDTDRVAAYAEVTRHLGLQVRYRGFHLYFDDTWPYGEPFEVVHARGALDGVISAAGANVQGVLALIHHALRQGGEMFLSHNTHPTTAAFVAHLDAHREGWEVLRNDMAITRAVRL
jgi:SAM-dependent methyltransferase